MVSNKKNLHLVDIRTLHTMTDIYKFIYPKGLFIIELQTYILLSVEEAADIDSRFTKFVRSSYWNSQS